MKPLLKDIKVVQDEIKDIEKKEQLLRNKHKSRQEKLQKLMGKLLTIAGAFDWSVYEWILETNGVTLTIVTKSVKESKDLDDIHKIFCNGFYHWSVQIEKGTWLNGDDGVLTVNFHDFTKACEFIKKHGLKVRRYNSKKGTHEELSTHIDLLKAELKLAEQLCSLAPEETAERVILPEHC